MTDQAKLIEDLRTYPWGVDDTPEGPRLLKRAADLLTSQQEEIEKVLCEWENAYREYNVERSRANQTEFLLAVMAACAEGEWRKLAAAYFTIQAAESLSQSTGDTK